MTKIKTPRKAVIFLSFTFTGSQFVGLITNCASPSEPYCNMATHEDQPIHFLTGHHFALGRHNLGPLATFPNFTPSYPCQYVGCNRKHMDKTINHNERFPDGRGRCKYNMQIQVLFKLSLLLAGFQVNTLQTASPTR